MSFIIFFSTYKGQKSKEEGEKKKSEKMIYCTLLFTLQKYGCHFVSSLYTIQSVHTPFKSPILSTNQKYEKR